MLRQTRPRGGKSGLPRSLGDRFRLIPAVHPCNRSLTSLEHGEQSSNPSGSGEGKPGAGSVRNRKGPDAGARGMGRGRGQGGVGVPGRVFSDPKENRTKPGVSIETASGHGAAFR